MIETVEPIEAATVLVALSGVILSVTLVVDAYRTVNRAVDARAGGSVVTIAMVRLLTESIRAMLNWLVLIAAGAAAVTPPPTGPTAARPLLQWIWLALASGLVALSVLNSIGTRRVLRQIEQEAGGES